jgi:hypothetical protein
MWSCVNKFHHQRFLSSIEFGVQIMMKALRYNEVEISSDKVVLVRYTLRDISVCGRVC